MPGESCLWDCHNQKEKVSASIAAESSSLVLSCMPTSIIESTMEGVSPSYGTDPVMTYSSTCSFPMPQVCTQPTVSQSYNPETHNYWGYDPQNYSNLPPSQMVAPSPGNVRT